MFEFVNNMSDRTFVLRYQEPPPLGGSLEVTVPPRSKGVGLTTAGNVWRGTVTVMMSDCVEVGHVDVTAGPSLLLIASDGTFSLVSDHVADRTDIGGAGYEQTSRCTGS
ncbi:MAG: hypothetical protein ACRDF7_00840 [Candidatus Limnocylindrales bacterium]